MRVAALAWLAARLIAVDCEFREKSGGQ